jgi:hypothetical protein
LIDLDLSAFGDQDLDDFDIGKLTKVWHENFHS